MMRVAIASGNGNFHRHRSRRKFDPGSTLFLLLEEFPKLEFSRLSVYLEMSNGEEYIFVFRAFSRSRQRNRLN